METFNHTLIYNHINECFGLTSYKRGRLTYFKKNNHEIGFIENIPASKKYVQTVYSSFFDFDNLDLNNQITKKIQELYKSQKELFTENKNIIIANSNDIPQMFLFN